MKPTDSEPPEWTDRPDPFAHITEQRLADLLEECLRAESARPGSSAEILQALPEHLRREMQELVALGQALRRNSASIRMPSGASRKALWVRITRGMQDPRPLVGGGHAGKRFLFLLGVLWRAIRGRF